MLEDDAVGKDLVDAINHHTEERRQLFVAGFARFVIDRGAGSLAPPRTPNAKPETWQAVGRRLYGADLFNQVLTRELAARKESTHAQVGIPAVRSDQGEVPPGGQTAGGSEDLGRQDHKQPRRKRPAPPPPST